MNITPPQTVPEAYAIDVWYSKTLLARIVGGLRIVAKRARLEWNTANKQIRCVYVDESGNPIGDIFQLAASDFTYASLSIDLIYLRTKDNSYQFQPRSGAITATYIMSGGGMSSSVVGAIALRKQGIAVLMEMLKSSGVRVAKPNFLRGVAVGIGVGLLLIVGFVIFLLSRA